MASTGSAVARSLPLATVASDNFADLRFDNRRPAFVNQFDFSWDGINAHHFMARVGETPGGNRADIS